MDLHAQTDRLARLLEERLGLRGKGFAVKVQRAGRRLPKYIRGEAVALVDALAIESHPKLSQQVDTARLERAFKDVERYLLGVDPWARRRGIFLNWLAGQAFNLLIIIVLVLALLRWRGFL